jgi:voltage-gated sodium channel
VTGASRLAEKLELPVVQHALISLILINALILGLETSQSLMQAWGPWLIAADKAILAIFVVEIALRLLAQRLAYFRDPWNIFDFSVVAISLVPASGSLAVLRALRVLRVLRLIKLVPSMKRVVGGLLSALPGLGSVAAIIGLIFYVSAVIATKLFGADFPEWFGTLGASAFTLFQVMTLESWAMGIVRPVMELFPQGLGIFPDFHPDLDVHHAQSVHRRDRQCDPAWPSPRKSASPSPCLAFSWSPGWPEREKHSFTPSPLWSSSWDHASRTTPPHRAGKCSTKNRKSAS